MKTPTIYYVQYNCFHNYLLVKLIQVVLLNLHCVSKKTGHLRYFQISPTKLDQYQ